MESTEEEFSSFTTKGRRTKRQRSLLAASASASSSYRGGDGGGCSGSSSSASASDEHDVIMTEEEDMANCLILLAQGIERKGSNIIKSKMNNNNNIGVYECKTCNKTFPSFQALGGHRTSHKKTIKPPPPSSSPDHHDEHRDVVVDHLDVMEFRSVNKNIVVVQTHDNKARVHECSICGSEFPSGQALGGHMRRHRGAAPPSTTVSHGGLPMISPVIDTGGPRNILSLDLNLPAPEDQDDDDQQARDDDHHIETKFVHVLPRPAPLVDCHY